MRAKHVKSAKSYLVAKNGMGSAQTLPFDKFLRRGPDYELGERDMLGYTTDHIPTLTEYMVNLSNASKALQDRTLGQVHKEDFQTQPVLSINDRGDGFDFNGRQAGSNALWFVPGGKTKTATKGFARFMEELADGGAAYRTSQEHVATKAKKLAAGARKKAEEGAKKSVNLNNRRETERRDQDQRIASHKKTDPPKERRSKPRAAVHPKQPKPKSFAEFKSRQGSR